MTSSFHSAQGTPMQYVGVMDGTSRKRKAKSARAPESSSSRKGISIHKRGATRVNRYPRMSPRGGNLSQPHDLVLLLEMAPHFSSSSLRDIHRLLYFVASKYSHHVYRYFRDLRELPHCYYLGVRSAPRRTGVQRCAISQ